MNTQSYLFALAIFCGSLAPATAVNSNYPSRRALVADVCPHLKVTKFSFENVREEGRNRVHTTYSWQNVGQKDIVAFELVVLKYDPFNRVLTGSRAIWPGHNTVSYASLKPGETDADGCEPYSDEETFTAICFVSKIRFSDSTIWTVDAAAVPKEVKRLAPDISEVGPLEPPNWKVPAEGK